MHILNPLPLVASFAVFYDSLDIIAHDFDVYWHCIFWKKIA